MSYQSFKDANREVERLQATNHKVTIVQEPNGYRVVIEQPLSEELAERVVEPEKSN